MRWWGVSTPTRSEGGDVRGTVAEGRAVVVLNGCLGGNWGAQAGLNGGNWAVGGGGEGREGGGCMHREDDEVRCGVEVWRWVV